MRRIDRRRGRAIAAWAALAALVLAGASPQKKKQSDTPPKVEETVANLAQIMQIRDIDLEGVGLVVGLPNTGVDPPDSPYRRKLIDEMLKANIEHPNLLLTDPTMTMVIVRMKVMTGTSTKDRIDVSVELPPGSGTTSLAGGYLVQSRLRIVGRDQHMEGHDSEDKALAHGPIMVGTDLHPNDPKFGRVLGGGRVLHDLPYFLVLRENRRTAKNAAILERVINQRFHHTGTVKQEGASRFKSEEYLILKVPDVYHHNPGRYHEVIKHIPVVDSPLLRTARQETWGRDLLDVSKSGMAAINLEGQGFTAIPMLKAGLASTHKQVKFFAAEALAYLNDPAGVDTLGDAVANWPEFRTYALAALAALDQPASRAKLRKLMDNPDIPVRYGAFNALRTLDENDVTLGRVPVLEEPPASPDEEELDPMALALRRARRRSQMEDPFALYIVECDGPPLIHATQTNRCEIVLFGRGMKLLTPIVLGSDAIQIDASSDDDKVRISRIITAKGGPRTEKVTASLDVADVLRRTANLHASYPEICTLLAEAAKRRNLPGPLIADAVPAANVVYKQAALGLDVTKKDDAVGKASSESTRPRRRGLFGRMFGRDSETEAEAPPAKTVPANSDSKQDDAVNKASLESPPAKRRGLFGFMRGGNDGN